MLCFVCEFSDSAAYRRALFGEHRIRDCCVKIERLTDSDIHKATTQKKVLQLATSVTTLRSNVMWIPTSSQIQKNSTGALSALNTYRDKFGVASSVGQKNVIRNRVKSLFIEKPNQFDNEKKLTMDDLHIEFNKKYSSPNRGLKSNFPRQLPKLQPQLSECQKIYNELNAKLAAKRAPRPPPFPVESVKLSWCQLKALVAKRYPAVKIDPPSTKRRLPPVKPSPASEKSKQTIKELCKCV